MKVDRRDSVRLPRTKLAPLSVAAEALSVDVKTIRRRIADGTMTGSGD